MLGWLSGAIDSDSVWRWNLSYLVAIEGIDGAGKGTQARALVEQLARLHMMAGSMSFPQYSETMAGGLIGSYLNGEFGSSVNPKVATLLYAVDRYESRGRLRDQLDDNDVVVIDRYVGSNMAYQGARIHPRERVAEFRDWAQELEFDVFRLPRPSLTILIDMPVDAAAKLVASKPPRSYTGLAADVHEADEIYMERVRREYLLLAEKLDWVVVSGKSADGRLKTVSELGAELLRIVLKGMNQLYRLDPQWDFCRTTVAMEVHKTWSSVPWESSSKIEQEDSIKSADAAIAEVVRQLSLNEGSL
jgi:dTMP kinase